MRYNHKLKLITYITLSLSTLGAVPLHATEAESRIESTGIGYRVYNAQNEKYWFELNGQLKLDQTFFMGRSQDRGAEFPTGANVRTAEISLNGGVNENWSYMLTLGFDGVSNEIVDAYLKHPGLTKNSNVYVGQVPVPYSFENSTSSKWISFLERSLPTVAFAPTYGLGVMYNTWGEMLTMTVSATNPKHGTHPGPETNDHHGDRLGIASRFTFSPVHTQDEVYHFSFSARYQGVVHTINGIPFSDIRFRTRPEARARETTQILDTKPIRGRSYTVYGGEIATIQGPWTIQAEYGEAHVQRVGSAFGNNRFYGGYIQASYIITGESRTYHFHTGTLGRIKPQSDCGAFEVAIRQSYLNLNSKDIRGGEGFDTGFSLGWYATNNIRVFGNYIRSYMRPSDNTKRKLDIFAIRAQVVF